ncbi:hypothetical protein FE784_30355 [Paenibacillus hemerocallicola]|uniref:Uncharacterized protein n=1 Tax=Paenibacillus hemerocallicola TaxID=1172614 RepID=A0A5C4T0A8_9BACL|nr:heparinase II/III family protein [Paenibacillus hemerocallicola]TNJ62471.1 hypothetical protein FE784_30355 [Paenibacillus hemerocallicola]
MKQLYPYYVVHEADHFDRLPVAGRFLQGDTMNTASLKTEFAAYTRDGKLHIRVWCHDADQQCAETIRLNFDPDHSGRRPHNVVQVFVESDGSTRAETMEYDIVRFTPVDGVQSRSELKNGVWEITVELPLDLVYKSRGTRPYIGLNVIRVRKGHSTSKWSGLPGEISVHCLQGIGDLLFAEGLSSDQLNDWIERAVQDSNTAYTKWEKQKLPPDMLRHVRAKKSGFSLRIKREDAERARMNARETEWGALIARRIYEVADYWASKSDDELFDFIIPGNPRAMTPSQFYGDPLTGGNRLTLKTCLETPFRFINEKTGEWWYPGKRLTNPTTGEEVVVEDNGEGFLIPEGFPNPYTRCMLVAATRNYRLAMAMAAPYCPSITDKDVVPETSGTKYAGGIPNLAYAYILSGDVRYAYKAAILIGRIAELYPYMNGGYHDGSYSDTVHLSEPSTTGTEWKKNVLEAYDLIFDGIDSFHDDLTALFSRKPDAENRQRDVPFDLRRAVEQEMIPYVIYTCELERSGASDWSMRLLELEMEAAALIQNGELLHRVLTDSAFSLFSKLKNGYYRDGKYAYDSSGYVEMMSYAMMNYPNWTYLFQDEGQFRQPFNLFEDPRFGIKEIISFYYRYRCGSLSAAFGDTPTDNLLPISDKRKSGMTPYLALSETVFRRMPSARDVIGPALSQYDREELARLRVEACTENGRGGNQSLLVLANALADEDLQPYRGKASPGIQPSFLLEDSEVSILRSGSSARNSKHLVLYGQPTLPHAHGDKLGLWLGAFGVHQLAFGGHYPYIWIGPKISQWELHSASCNVVLVDGKNQAPSSSIQLEHYEGSLMQVAGMENKEAYPGSHYERWAWLIQAPDGENAYVLDQFFVKEGSRFDYNTHGLDVPLERVEFEGVEQWEEMQGTLAGEDVPLYGQPGYGWMKAVRRAKASKRVSWTYPYGDSSLKITALNTEEMELICCLGEKGGQEMKKSSWDAYVLLRDEQADPAGHAASFLAVMEPYESRPFLQSVQAMELIEGKSDVFPPVGVCVTHPDGSRDILISNKNVGQSVTFRDETGMKHTTDAQSLFIRYRGDRPVRLEALGFTAIDSGGLRVRQPHAVWHGIVTDVDVDRRQIGVEFGQGIPDSSQFPGSVGFISGDGYKKPSPYYIRDPRLSGNKLVFRTDITLLRGEEGWKGTEKARVQQGKPVIAYMGKRMLADVKTGDRFAMKNRIYEEWD